MGGFFPSFFFATQIEAELHTIDILKYIITKRQTFITDTKEFALPHVLKLRDKKMFEVLVVFILISIPHFTAGTLSIVLCMRHPDEHSSC